jgi:1,4-alpha-glucan branching enzyme
MYQNSMPSGGRMPHRYSAKKMEKPVNFVCLAPQAESVCVIGDFNQWREEAHPMTRRPDGAWFAAIPMNHGHHRYVFIVDGEKQLDPEAQGIARNDHNERVSLISVS